MDDSVQCSSNSRVEYLKNSMIERESMRSSIESTISTSLICGREDLVVGDEAPVGGVAQVIGHGVKVIGVEVGVHEEEGEKDEEVR